MSWIAAIKVLGVYLALLHIVPGMIYIERKVCAWIQDRSGPNRVGPAGLLQPVADAIKLIFKEDIIPERADRVLFTLAPLLAMVPAAMAFAVIPFGDRIGGEMLQIASVDIGVLYIVSISSLGVYGIAFGGWASNNKFSLLGGLRASAQLISYEVALGLALVAMIMTTGSVRLEEMVRFQGEPLLGPIPRWGIFVQPVAAVIFLAAAFAENNRLPFDLAECEPELVGGYHTEYSSLKFAMFFMGEYLAMVTMSALMVTLFLGGWHFPGIERLGPGSWTYGLASIAVFGAKLALVLFFYVWVRWTLPRFRYDQLMQLGWKTLIPLALANILVTGIVGIQLGSV